MTQLSKRTLFWAPRALAIAYIGFLGLFALDVFGEGYGLWRTFLGLAVHLIPAWGLIVVLALAWRHEWIGAAFYAAAGVLYVVSILSRPLLLATKLNWILMVAGPAFVVAALFLAGWLKRSQLRPNGI